MKMKKNNNKFYNKTITDIVSKYTVLLSSVKLLRTNLLLAVRIDWLTISAVIILGYALLRSGMFLFIYLFIWNLFPPSQFFLIFNPISYEIYLVLLSFFLAW